VMTYNEQSEALMVVVEALVRAEAQRLVHREATSGRLQQELDEASDRLVLQTRLMNNLQLEAKEAVGGQSLQSEKTLEREVVNCSSEVAAKSLALSLAKQTLSTLDEEHAKLIELSEDSGAVDQRKERVVTTTAAVEALRAQVAEEEAVIAQMKMTESELEEAGRMAEPAKEARCRSFDADKDSLRSLRTLQERFLARDLYALESASNVHEESAEVAQERRKLLLEGRQLMSACQALTDQQTSKVEAEEAAYTSEHAVACEKLEEAKRRVRSERKAVEVAHVERQRYLFDKISQLEIEQKQLWAATCEVNERAACVSVIEGEIEGARRAVELKAAELTVTEGVHRGSADQLEELRAANKQRSAELRLQVDSERRVHIEQQSYVHSLRSRLKVAAEL